MLFTQGLGTSRSDKLSKTVGTSIRGLIGT